MQESTVNRIEKGQVYEGFLLARAVEVKTASNGNKYVDWTLCDVTGDINGKQWDVPADIEKYFTRPVVKVRGLVQEYNGKLQMRVERVRLSTPQDQIDIQDFVPSAPNPPEEMLDRIRSTTKAFKDEGIRKIVEYELDRLEPQLMYYPAAQSLHHAVRGGLLYHITTMLYAAKVLLPVYPFLDRDLLLGGVILHDLCKIEEMKSDEMGIVSEYTREGIFLSHLVLGVQRIGEAGAALCVDSQTVVMLQHMILSHHYEPEFGSPRRPMFPEAEMLHWLDIMDARLYDMHHALVNTKPGEFSEKVWSLENRRVYRRMPEGTHVGAAGHEVP